VGSRFGRPLGRRQFEPSEAEPRHNHAAYQAPAAKGLGRLPRTAGDQCLRLLTGQDVRSELVGPGRSRLRCDRQGNGMAGVPKPHLIRVDAVPVRTLVLFEKEVDRGSGRPAADRLCTPGLPIPAAFRMRLKTQSRNDQCCGVRRFDKRLLFSGQSVTLPRSLQTVDEIPAG